MSKRNPDSPPRDTCHLTLTIRGTDYLVTPTASTCGRGWRLRRLDGGGEYEVFRGVGGVFCTCEDARYRPGEHELGCKHARALCATGLVKAPSIAARRSR